MTYGQKAERYEEIEELLHQAGAQHCDEMLDALNDGELLARLGVTDADQEIIEEMTSDYSTEVYFTLK